MQTANQAETFTANRTSVSNPFRAIGTCKCGKTSAVNVRTETTFTNWQPTETIFCVRGAGRFRPQPGRPGFVGKCPACKGSVHFRSVQGTFSAKHKCGAKCQNSTTRVCECSCGGENHGAAHGQ